MHNVAYVLYWLDLWKIEIKIFGVLSLNVGVSALLIYYTCFIHVQLQNRLFCMFVNMICMLIIWFVV